MPCDLNTKYCSDTMADDLSYTNDYGIDTVVSNELDKANVLSNYFSSVINTDSCEVVPLAMSNFLQLWTTL